MLHSSSPASEQHTGFEQGDVLAKRMSSEYKTALSTAKIIEPNSDYIHTRTFADTVKYRIFIMQYIRWEY